MDISITTTIIALHLIDVWLKKIVAEFGFYDKKMTNYLVNNHNHQASLGLKELNPRIKH